MLTSHDNRISPFPCLLACLTVPACLYIGSTAVKWIWIAELERSLPILSFVLSMPTYRLCLLVSWSTTTFLNETVLPAECLWWRFCEIDQYHCPQKGPYFQDLVLYKDLFDILGPYLFFRVLIFAVLASFMQRMSILSASIQQWFRFKLLANFDFHLCLRFDFHTLSFWVLILAALGPYWVLISQKKWVLISKIGGLY